MRARVFGIGSVALAGLIVVMFAAVPAGQQGERQTAATYKVERTPWGHPDFQGTWDVSTLTPLERPTRPAANCR